MFDMRDRPKAAKRATRSMAGLSSIVASNVRGNACQVVAELVAATVDRARDRPRDSCAVQR